MLPHPDKVAFAMNGGMFDENGEPIGYYVEGGQRVHTLNRNQGGGNFHLMPNGVFYGTGSEWHVRTTEDFAANVDERPEFATQSGPMLVIDGNLHPAFDADGESRKTRNAVGVDRDVARTGGTRELGGGERAACRIDSELEEPARCRDPERERPAWREPHVRQRLPADPDLRQGLLAEQVEADIGRDPQVVASATVLEGELDQASVGRIVLHQEDSQGAWERVHHAELEGRCVGRIVACGSRARLQPNAPDPQGIATKRMPYSR